MRKEIAVFRKRHYRKKEQKVSAMRKAVEDAEVKKILDENREHQRSTHPHVNDEVEEKWDENRRKLASRMNPSNIASKTEEEIKQEFIERARW